MTERRTAEVGADPRPGDFTPFEDVLCAVDGSRGAGEAVAQAIALCEGGASLGFLAVSHSVGTGLVAQAELSEARARSALEDAAQRAREAGIQASTELRSGAQASDLLLEEASRHDLLVVGSRGGSRIGNVLLGSTASQIVHRTDGPVLVSRRAADGDDFPRRLLLATDGSHGSWAAARAATRLARSPHAVLHLVYVPDGMHPERYREVLKQLTMIERATGAPPRVIDEPGHVADQICDTAAADRSSLIAIGRRGLTGLKALGSVSERVVHRAPCSVLVVPPEPGGA